MGDMNFYKVVNAFTRKSIVHMPLLITKNQEYHPLPYHPLPTWQQNN
jgi:hypothetical protein